MSLISMLPGAFSRCPSQRALLRVSVFCLAYVQGGIFCEIGVRGLGAHGWPPDIATTVAMSARSEFQLENPSLVTTSEVPMYSVDGIRCQANITRCSQVLPTPPHKISPRYANSIVNPKKNVLIILQLKSYRTSTLSWKTYKPFTILVCECGN